MQKMREYEPGDIIAVLRHDKKKAVSCKVVEKGQGETKSGSIVFFDDIDVLWKLGYNKKWPGWVYRAFKGEVPEGAARDTENNE